MNDNDKEVKQQNEVRKEAIRIQVERQVKQQQQREKKDKQS